MESEGGTLNKESIVPIEKCTLIIDEKQANTMNLDNLDHHDEDTLMIAQSQNLRLNDNPEPSLIQEEIADFSTQCACGMDDNSNEDLVST